MITKYFRFVYIEYKWVYRKLHLFYDIRMHWKQIRGGAIIDWKNSTVTRDDNLSIVGTQDFLSRMQQRRESSDKSNNLVKSQSKKKA